MNTIKAPKNSNLIPTVPNDISLHIIGYMTKNESNLYKLALVSKSICVFIEMNKELLFSQMALSRKATYQNVVKIFKCIDKYLELPIYNKNLVRENNWKATGSYNFYYRSTNINNQEFLHGVTRRRKSRPNPNHLIIPGTEFVSEKKKYNLSMKDDVEAIIALKKKGCTLL
jgi:hypothetical protein